MQSTTKNKNNYSRIADLLTNDSFLAWQLDFPEADAKAWTRWMEEHPANAMLAEQAAAILAQLVESKKNNLSGYQINNSFERLLKKIAAQEKQLSTTF